MTTIAEQARALLNELGLSNDQAAIGVTIDGWILFLFPPAHQYHGVIPSEWHGKPISVERMEYPVTCAYE